MNGWLAFLHDPPASVVSPTAVALITCTPLRRSARNSEVSAELSGRTMLRTLPFGLSGHSAA